MSLLYTRRGFGPIAFTWLMLVSCLPAARAAADFSSQLSAREIEEAAELVQAMKRDPRGPYLRLRWFCKDGTIQPPAGTPCRERGGGVQHAQFSPGAERLAELGFHVGVLLTPLDFDQFFDQRSDHRLLRQLVIERYLQQVDDGWVLRRARYYRGARQIEDEERQGKLFLERLLSQPEWTDKHFLLVVQLASVVPHPGAIANETAMIRDLATAVANLDPDFQNLRAKIHSFPDEGDDERVEGFLRLKNRTESVRTKARELVQVMRLGRDPGRIAAMAERFSQRLPDLAPRLEVFADHLRAGRAPEALTTAASLAAELRRLLTTQRDGARNLQRLGLLQLVLGSAFTLAQETAGQESGRSRLERIRDLRHYHDLAFGAGLLTAREQEALAGEIFAVEQRSLMPAIELERHLAYLTRSLDWGRSAIRQTFGREYERMLAIEPKAYGFLDAQARGTILLPLSAELGLLEQDADRQLGQSHLLWDQPVSYGFWGLNPGLARGILDFAPVPATEWAPDPSRVYVIPDTLADLRPMAGILTLDAGNLLSHAQLLARNLGIPNASVTPELVPRLKALQGREVFYAVSPLGRIILGDPGQLDPAERTLMEASAPKPVRLDVSRLQLDRVEPIPLSQLSSADSGVTVGPKAANLGQLARLFPEHVAAGVALPFGMFRQHIDRPFRGSGATLAEEISEAYAIARRMEREGRTQEEVDRFMFLRLAYFRTAIEELPWVPEARTRIEEAIRALPGYRQGVFIRSDTNAEDLPEFSGAGLNLTVPHRKSLETILAGVKKVWASPFSERAYQWRRRILESQENVYCSVLLLRSVSAEESGVLITSGLEFGGPDDLTVVTAEGVGGAVEGQSAETLLIREAGTWKLLSQAKATYRRVLSAAGEGVEILPPRRDSTLLNAEKVEQLVRAVRRWKQSLQPEQRDVVWDMEFGFVGGKLWLFQVRPFVGARDTRTIERLRAFDRELIRLGQREISLEEPLS